MNAGLPDTHPSIAFYDSDYPGRETSAHASNFDETTVQQGLAYDIDRYRELVAHYGGPVLELCCGTGRVALPLARDGFAVTAVDIAAGMLAVLDERLKREPAEVAARVTTIQQDVTMLDLPQREYALAIIAFNSLLCITDFDAQCAAIAAAAKHLRAGGALVVDVVNPLVLPLAGDPIPKPFFTRRSESTGNEYTRFAALGPFDETQRQRLYGWYDEITSGTVRRTMYAMHWRPVFRYELELMLRAAGLRVVSHEGGHRHEEFTARSPKMFVVAEH